MVVTIGRIPASHITPARLAILLLFSILSASEKPKSLLIVFLTLSPSITRYGMESFLIILLTH